MSAEEMVANTFGRYMGEVEIRALVYLIARADNSTKYTDVEDMSYEDCIRWIEEHREQTERKLKKIVAVGDDGKLYGDSETVCNFVEYACVNNV